MSDKTNDIEDILIKFHEQMILQPKSLVGNLGKELLLIAAINDIKNIFKEVKQVPIKPHNPEDDGC